MARELSGVFPTSFCVCETWSLILKQENRRRVFGNRVLRGIFGRKKEGLDGDWAIA
jgi:hypothetical protein